MSTFSCVCFPVGEPFIPLGKSCCAVVTLPVYTTKHIAEVLTFLSGTYFKEIHSIHMMLRKKQNLLIKELIFLMKQFPLF